MCVHGDPISISYSISVVYCRDGCSVRYDTSLYRYCLLISMIDTFLCRSLLSDSCRDRTVKRYYLLAFLDPCELFHVDCQRSIGIVLFLII